jgi:hypothetical protein
MTYPRLSPGIVSQNSFQMTEGSLVLFISKADRSPDIGRNFTILSLEKPGYPSRRSPAQDLLKGETILPRENTGSIQVVPQSSCIVVHCHI